MEMRDLPELESVTCGGPAAHAVSVIGWIVISLFLGAFCAAAIEIAARLVTHRWPGPMIYVPVGVCFAGVAALWLARKNWLDWQWTTDSAGVSVHMLFGKRQVAWSEITEASVKSGSSGRIYYLRTASGRFGVADMRSSVGELIGASIYQHLRRFGKADESLLTPGARTLWMPIPREVPEEMDWHNPKPPNWSIALAVTVVIAIAAPIAFFLAKKIKLEPFWNALSHNGWLLIVGAYKMLRERLIMAHIVAIRHDHIEMRTPRGLVFLPWTDIHYVHWDNTRKTLSLGRTTYTDVAVIPYRQDWPDSAACILAIIRHLREAHHTPPVVIPSQLVGIMYSGKVGPVSAFGDGDSLTLRCGSLTFGAPIALLSVPLAVVAFWTVFSPSGWQGIRPLYLVLAALSEVLAITLIFASITTYRADASGLTASNLGRRKFIDWRDVASYVVTPGSGPKSGRVLIGTMGEVLARLPYSRAAADSETFLAYLDARLAPVRQHDLPTLTR